MIDNELILEKIHNNDPDAEELLITNNMGLVTGIAKRFINRGYEMEDLIQIGTLGLIKAMRKFDVGFNVKFSTYAVPLIIGEIKRFIRDDGIIKVSRTHKTNAMKVYKTQELLSNKLNRNPTLSEISKESGLNTEEIISAMEATTPVESLYQSSDSDDERELIEKFGAVNEENRIVDKVAISDSLKLLNPREREVIILRYFFDNTQINVSKKIGVSQVQVSRIEKAALNKMKLHLME